MTHMTNQDQYASNRAALHQVVPSVIAYRLHPNGFKWSDLLVIHHPSIFRRVKRPTLLPFVRLTLDMKLLPRDHDKILLHQIGYLAQKRLARGLKLNQTEATALIASQLQVRSPLALVD